MTIEEHKRFLEADFDDVKLDDLVDISKIRIDRNRTLERRKKQFIRAAKNPYLVKVGDTMVKIRFANNGISFEEAFENLLLMS
ncbi:MAG: hypothetical protein HUJ98_04610 [Bacteroidaceae bacterium]|nr:hypothetical protein [Bacteroidaceae bacterium]